METEYIVKVNGKYFTGESKTKTYHEYSQHAFMGLVHVCDSPNLMPAFEFSNDIEKAERMPLREAMRSFSQSLHERVRYGFLPEIETIEIIKVK